MRLALGLAALAALSGTAAATGGGDRLARIALEAGLPRLAAGVAADPALKGYAQLTAGDFAAAAATLEPIFEPVSLYNRAEALAKLGRLDDAVWLYDLALDEQRRMTRTLAEDVAVNRELVTSLIKVDVEGGGTAATNAKATAEKERSLGDQAGSGTEDATSGAGRAGTRESAAEAEAPGGSKVARLGLSRQGKESGEGEARGSAGDAGGAGRSGGQAMAAAMAITTLAQQKVLRQKENRSVPATRQWLKTMADNPGAFLKLQIVAEQERRKRAGLAAPPSPDEW